MSLISKETLLTHLQRAEMASDVRLPIEFFRDLVYQAMPRTWVELTEEQMNELWANSGTVAGYNGLTFENIRAVSAKLKELNT